MWKTGFRMTVDLLKMNLMTNNGGQRSLCLSENLIRPTHNRRIVNTHTRLGTMTGLNDKGTSEEEKRQTKEEVAAEGNHLLQWLK